MALQTGYEHHSKNFYANEEALENKWNANEAEAAYEGRDLDAEQAPAVHHDTIDQAELYNGMALQTGYEHHSQNFIANEEASEKEWNAREAQAAYEGKDLDAEQAPAVHHDTIDQAELYNGMAVQLDGIHSAAYYESQEEQENSWAAADAKKDAEMSTAEREAFHKANSPTFVPDTHIVPTDLTPPHRNFDVDTSIYKGLDMSLSYVQLADHTNDQDDVVPEFSEEIRDQQPQQIAEAKHFDFAGEEIKETYDE
jgi:hypothetical protein